jgi:hypothetical protein
MLSDKNSEELPIQPSPHVKGAEFTGLNSYSINSLQAMGYEDNKIIEALRYLKS